MKQTAEQYQREYFEKQGYTIFENIEEASMAFCDLYPRIITTSDAIDNILNDTNCDWVVLNDGSVAAHKLAWENRKKREKRAEKEEELYKKMQTGEITILKYKLFEKDMTTSRLAEMTNINKRTLEEYVAGRRNFRSIALEKGLAIAEAFECDIYELI